MGCRCCACPLKIGIVAESLVFVLSSCALTLYQNAHEQREDDLLLASSLDFHGAAL